MTYSLVASPTFRRAAKRFLKQHPELREAFDAMLSVLADDPFAPALRTHPLHGQLEGTWAARITHAYRVTFALHSETNEIDLLDVGSHDAVYR